LYILVDRITQSMSDKTFVFSKAVNGKYIIELYAGDYVMIEETFTDVLLEYDSFVQKINTSFHDGDPRVLKSAIHKIKPLFGFVGLTEIQARCARFENACQDAPSCPALAEEYGPLFEQLVHARAIIQEEQARLVKFNQNH
jgi:HPt (histidine-containing phosphotransfer) domain-containing protein